MWGLIHMDRQNYLEIMSTISSGNQIFQEYMMAMQNTLMKDRTKAILCQCKPLTQTFLLSARMTNHSLWWICRWHKVNISRKTVLKEKRGGSQWVVRVLILMFFRIVHSCTKFRKVIQKQRNHMQACRNTILQEQSLWKCILLVAFLLTPPYQCLRMSLKSGFETRKKNKKHKKGRKASISCSITAWRWNATHLNVF